MSFGTQPQIVGATYENTLTGTQVTLEGLAVSGVYVKNKTTGSVDKVSVENFQTNYVLTDEHNHEQYCCSVHELHVRPHKGCVLR